MHFLLYNALFKRDNTISNRPTTERSNACKIKACSSNDGHIHISFNSQLLKGILCIFYGILNVLIHRTDMTNFQITDFIARLLQGELEYNISC